MEFIKYTPIAKKLLMIESVVLFSYLTAFMISYCRARALDPLWANHFYAELAEYIVISLGIVLLSGLLVNIVERGGLRK